MRAGIETGSGFFEVRSVASLVRTLPALPLLFAALPSLG
jgi:hypothetical protein